MEIIAIRTQKVTAKQCLCSFLCNYISDLQEGSILVITSKIVSICEGCVFSKDEISKDELIDREADVVISGRDNKYGICLTIKDNIVIPSAGIDESNGNDCYIVYPENVFASAKEVWTFFTKKYNLSNLGILITDSHTTPFRRGVIGIALGWCGFEPLYSYIGKNDIFNRQLKATNVNVPDSLASAAVFEMGEGDEQTPIAIIKNAPRITFCRPSDCVNEREKIAVPIDEDMYYPLLQKFVTPKISC